MGHALPAPAFAERGYDTIKAGCCIAPVVEGGALSALGTARLDALHSHLVLRYCTVRLLFRAAQSRCILPLGFGHVQIRYRSPKHPGPGAGRSSLLPYVAAPGSVGRRPNHSR